ncbi:beta-1,3-galactosyltransferase 1-like [Watersipora subatra]|uniref:beta-1,3-galactosyltransferase 1-like n=1 Tax=Watersipora subatra TaxID=2589382 RepID=UPI00355BA0E8
MWKSIFDTIFAVFKTPKHFITTCYCRSGVSRGSRRHQKENKKAQLYKHANPSLYYIQKQPSNLCTNNTFLFIAVISQPSSQKHRQIYRETVLSPIRNECLIDSKYVFVIGRVDNDAIQDLLDKENEEHGDILQGNFTDSYENLTIKSIFLVRWTALKCPQAKYLLKIDEDVYTILDNVRKYFKRESFNEYSIAGSIVKKAKPIRDPDSKWYAGTYSGAVYPTSASGMAYAFSQSLLEPLFKAAINTPFFRLEDVFLSGLAASATNLQIEYYQIPGFVRVEQNISNVNLKKFTSIHGLHGKQLKALHKRIKQEKHENCV